MAKLLPESIELPDDYFSDKGFDLERYQQIWNEFDKNNQTIGFPVADGQAVYKVVSVNPPVLQHVYFGDAWYVHPALIRGLTSEDIQGILDADAAMKELFGGL